VNKRPCALVSLLWSDCLGNCVLLLWTVHSTLLLVVAPNAQTILFTVLRVQYCTVRCTTCSRLYRITTPYYCTILDRKKYSTVLTVQSITPFTSLIRTVRYWKYFDTNMPATATILTSCYYSKPTSVLCILLFKKPLHVQSTIIQSVLYCMLIHPSPAWYCHKGQSENYTIF